MTEQTAIRWEKDADNIVTLTLDDPTQSANTMNELYGRPWLKPLRAPASRKGRHRRRDHHFRQEDLLRRR
jgi:hypothetical protein